MSIHAMCGDRPDPSKVGGRELYCMRSKGHDRGARGQSQTHRDPSSYVEWQYGADGSVAFWETY